LISKNRITSSTRRCTIISDIETKFTNDSLTAVYMYQHQPRESLLLLLYTYAHMWCSVWQCFKF